MMGLHAHLILEDVGEKSEAIFLFLMKPNLRLKELEVNFFLSLEPTLLTLHLAPKAMS